MRWAANHRTITAAGMPSICSIRGPLPLTGLQQYHLYARQVDVEGDGLAEGRDDIFCGTWWNQKLPQKLPQNLTQFCNGNSKSYVLLKKLYLTRSDHSWPGMDK